MKSILVRVYSKVSLIVYVSFSYRLRGSVREEGGLLDLGWQDGINTLLISCVISNKLFN